jgi:hypothetical protein
VGPSDRAACLLAKPINRDSEQHAAKRELSRHLYTQYQPSLAARIETRVFRWLVTLLDHVGTLNGTIGLIIALALAAALVFLLQRRLGPLRGPGLTDHLELSGPMPAASYHQEAARRAASGDWPAAILAAMRALARRLEERGVVDPQPGRTAHELAITAGQALPTQRAQLLAAAQLFDRVQYGGGVADQSGYALLCAAYDAVADVRATVGVL